MHTHVHTLHYIVLSRHPDLQAAPGTPATPQKTRRKGQLAERITTIGIQIGR